MKKRVLFIDRDGTIIVEPEQDKQVDSLEKLEFLPGAITNLAKIVRDTDFVLVMVTNQDGLGTSSFPESDFWPAHTKMLKTLEGEKVLFTNVHIDTSFEHENSPTRKPGTEMLREYFSGDFDLENSFVIGDRKTDIQLATNLSCQAIFFSEKTDPRAVLSTNSWDEIYHFLLGQGRKARVHRKTRETDIYVEVNLQGSGQTSISTGLGFFDHMLDQLGKHSGMDLIVKVNGDLHVDEHHTIEDTGIALGEAIETALGDKKGIERYGFVLPMDDALAQVALDLGGRSWLIWKADFKREKIGDMPTEMFYHFFKSFSDAAKCNLNIQVHGENEHHKIEAVFKGLAKALKMAIRKDERNLNYLPSTKGML